MVFVGIVLPLFIAPLIPNACKLCREAGKQSRVQRSVGGISQELAKRERRFIVLLHVCKAHAATYPR